MKDGYRGLVLSDMHCGHRTGLTMPKWWQGQCADLQAECWQWFDSTTKALGPFDFALYCGDLIEGKMKRNQGVELIEKSCLEQSKMAQAVVEHLNIPKNYFVYGTPYHVSDDGEDYEAMIAENVGGQIENQILLDVDGVVINMRHHVGGSSMAFNWTSLSKEVLADVLWSAATDREKANIILRGHCHRYHYTGGIQADGDPWTAIILPCLQLWTKFGGRRVTSPPINYGVTVLDIKEGRYSWEAHTMSLKGSQEITRFLTLENSQKD